MKWRALGIELTGSDDNITFPMPVVYDEDEPLRVEWSGDETTTVTVWRPGEAVPVHRQVVRGHVVAATIHSSPVIPVVTPEDPLFGSFLSIDED